jgi:hypothetical protein
MESISARLIKPVMISARDLEGAVRVVTFGPDPSKWPPEGTKAPDGSATPFAGRKLP